ncbi:McrC family protein [Shewanella sp. A25]|nr:McrC family protein [Shewanella shenzhenensis]
MHTTVFEYGYLTFESAANQELGAELISVHAFEYLKQVLLSSEAPENNKYLALIKRYGYELIQVKNYVGVLFTPTGEHIEVLPKVGRNRLDCTQAVHESREMLLLMLQHLGSFRYLASNQANISSKQMPLLEVFIEQFLHSVSLLVKKGLRSDYVSNNDNLYFQKGKLLVSKQQRHNLINKHKFFVEYDEYLLDRPANRLIKSALAKLVNVAQLASNQRLLRELQFVFADVPFSQSVKQDIGSLKLDRSMQDYHVPIAWSKLVLEGVSPLSMKGDHSALSLLFPMEAVFESYVASVLRTQLVAGVELATQARSQYLVSHDEQDKFQLKPDLLVTLHDKSNLVLDTKWKLLDLNALNYGLSQADFYQMFAYGHKYLSGKGDLVLIYPQTETFEFPIKEPFCFADGLRLWVIPFHISLEGRSRLVHCHDDTELTKLLGKMLHAT